MKKLKKRDFHLLCSDLLSNKHALLPDVSAFNYSVGRHHVSLASNFFLAVLNTKKNCLKIDITSPVFDDNGNLSSVCEYLFTYYLIDDYFELTNYFVITRSDCDL